MFINARFQVLEKHWLFWSVKIFSASFARSSTCSLAGMLIALQYHQLGHYQEQGSNHPWILIFSETVLGCIQMTYVFRVTGLDLCNIYQLSHTLLLQISSCCLSSISVLQTTIVYTYWNLCYIEQQAKQLGILLPSITFDQPLWLKAVEIITASKLNILCCLGGFHTGTHELLQSWSTSSKLVQVWPLRRAVSKK